MGRFILLLTFVCWPFITTAQEQRWIQIEAHPSLLQAETQAREYANTLPDIAAFSLGSGWYAISMGPYDPDTAAEQFNAYRTSGIFPGDSFVSTGENYRQKIWPLGDTPTQPDVTVPAPPPATAEPATDTAPQETLQESRQAEAALSRDEKRELQKLLEWAGVYRGSIDGLFGRGTRNSMAAWQTDNGFDPTGVLTTKQRQILFEQYNAVIADLGLRKITEAQAGISMALPLDKVTFGEYAAPMVHFRASDDGSEHVFLISMPGGQEDLRALFEIMQTLDVVPLESENKISSREFTLIGRTKDTYNYVQARIYDDAIKGFGIVWPTANPEQYARLLSEMKNSFDSVAGVLSPSLAQDIDLSNNATFGLQIRTPEFTRSGVYISDQGQILSFGNDFSSCKRILIEGDIEASAKQINQTSVMLITPNTPLAPFGTVQLGQPGVGLGQDVYLTSFPFGGALQAPTVTRGQLVENLGPDALILKLDADKNDLGGAILDQYGNLIGLLGSNQDKNRTLPKGAQMAIPTAQFSQIPELAPTSSAEITNVSFTDDALAEMLGKSATYIECWGN